MLSWSTRSTICFYHLTANKSCNWIHNLSHLFILSQGTHTTFAYLCTIPYCKHSIFAFAYLTPFRHLQLLENDKVLLIVDDNSGGILLYLDSQQSISAAVFRSPWKTLHRSKVGEACIFSYDEARRTLVVCETIKVKSSSWRAFVVTNYVSPLASTTHFHLWWAVQSAQLGKWCGSSTLVFFRGISHCHVLCSWEWRALVHWNRFSGKDILSVDTTVQVWFLELLY